MKYFVLLVLVVIAGGGIYYFFRAQPPSGPVTQTSTPAVTVTTTAPPEIPADWKTYTSQKYGFTISYPSDVIHDTTNEGERFYKHGPTQSTGTELYDGLIVLIKTGSLDGMTLQDFVQKQYQDIKNDPIEPTVTEIQSITLAGKSGWTFHVSSLGDRRTIFLPKSTTEYVQIDDMTVEPANREPTFETIVSTILATIRF